MRFMTVRWSLQVFVRDPFAANILRPDKYHSHLTIHNGFQKWVQQSIILSVVRSVKNIKTKSLKSSSNNLFIEICRVLCQWKILWYFVDNCKSFRKWSTMNELKEEMKYWWYLFDLNRKPVHLMLTSDRLNSIFSTVCL